MECKNPICIKDLDGLVELLPSPSTETPPRAKRKPARRRAKRKAQKVSKRGKKTIYPGIWQDEENPNKFTLLLTTRVDGRKVFRERTINGTLEDARDALQKLLTQMRQEKEVKQVAGGDETVDAFATKWIEHLKKAGNVKANTVSNYEHRLKTMILPYWGTKKVQKIKPKDCVDWMDFLSDNLSDYASKSLHGAWATFKMLIRWCCVQADLASPVELVRFEAKGQPVKEKHTLTPAQLERVKAEARKLEEPYATVVMILATTGARVGEIISLRPQDILKAENQILISRTLTSGVMSNSTKTGKARKVPLDPEVRERLENFKVDEPGGLLFTGKRGKFLQASNFKGPMAELSKAAELPFALTPHVFRRAMNDLLRRTKGPEVARQVLGHLNDEMTFHYATVSVEEMREAMDQAKRLAWDEPRLDPVGVVGELVGVEEVRTVQ